VKRSIQRTLELLASHPRSGRLAGFEDTVVLPAGCYPYLIYWVIEAGEAWIVHIRDARRRRWRGELDQNQPEPAPGSSHWPDKTIGLRYLPRHATDHDNRGAREGLRPHGAASVRDR
jgi:hypothetical protein